MKIIGVIPARYNSTRFPGKPLADICGKPMIWWVYQNVVKVKELDEVYVATDDERIVNICNEYGIKAIITSIKHKTVFDRVCEFSENVYSDYYVIVNADEPLINSKNITEVIKNSDYDINNAITKIYCINELADSTNIKVLFNNKMEAIYMSRNIVPYIYIPSIFDYYKHVGITVINRKALLFYKSSNILQYEMIEGIDHLRFIEHGQKMKFIKINSYNSISVDTPADLCKVIKIINQ